MTEKENALKVFQHEIPEWLPCYTKCTEYLFSDYTDAEKPQNFEGYDWFGVHWLPVEATANLTHPDIYQKPIFEEIDEWEENLVFPDLNTVLDWDKVSEQLNAQCDAVGDEKLTVIMLEHGLFERLTLLMGFENSLVALYDDPEACQAYCKAMADFKIKVIDKLVECCPRIDMFDWHDDLGSQAAALMSPDKWEEIFARDTARVAEHVRQIGKLFMYHSCGRVDQIIGRVLECVRPDGWNLLQSCNNQEEIKRKYGSQVALVCGLNTQEYIDIPDPKEEDLRREVDRTIQVFANGGGFFAGMYLAGCFNQNELNCNDVIEDEVTTVGAYYYDDPKHRIFPV